MRNVTLLIKPASSLCNMRCRYCFYEDEAQSRSVRSMGVMRQSTAQSLIDAAMDAVDPGGTVGFAFQGGEPTVAGLPFFESFVQTAAARNRKCARITYAIQTNGLLIDDAWASFFAAHRFLVGLSLDGDKALHDEYRTDASGKGTWNRVMRALTLLCKKGADVNLLCVVTGRCAKNPVRVYNTLKKTGVKHLQFIPCLDPLDVPRGSMPYSLTPEAYASFLCGLFDAWFCDWQHNRYTSVRLFDDYVHLMMGQPAGMCATHGACGGYCAVEADGSVYPCDFYVLDEWNLGSVTTTPLLSILQSDRALRFLRESANRPAECAACRYRALCGGGCKRDRVQLSDGTTKNVFCPAFQTFFRYAADRIAAVAQAEARFCSPQRRIPFSDRRDFLFTDL